MLGRQGKAFVGWGSEKVQAAGTQQRAPNDGTHIGVDKQAKSHSSVLQLT